MGVDASCWYVSRDTYVRTEGMYGMTTQAIDVQYTVHRSLIWEWHETWRRVLTTDPMGDRSQSNGLLLRYVNNDYVLNHLH